MKERLLVLSLWDGRLPLSRALWSSVDISLSWTSSGLLRGLSSREVHVGGPAQQEPVFVLLCDVLRVFCQSLVYVSDLLKEVLSLGARELAFQAALDRALSSLEASLTLLASGGPSTDWRSHGAR
jgi:hypothetical protein